MFSGERYRPVIEMRGFSFDPRIQKSPVSIENITYVCISKDGDDSYDIEKCMYIR